MKKCAASPAGNGIEVFHELSRQLALAAPAWPPGVDPAAFASTTSFARNQNEVVRAIEELKKKDSRSA